MRKGENMRKTVTYRFTGDEKIPAEITVGEYTTPVWIQKYWEDGEFAEYVQKNGCGHCCVAMAMQLLGKKMNPHEEYTHCRAIWGAPEEPYGHFLSVSGAAKSLNSFGVDAVAFAVLDRKAATQQILDALDAGKLVAFIVKPSEEYPEPTFSTGSHWVLAVGYDENGRVIIANTSSRIKEPVGVQVVDAQLIHNALYVGEELDESRTWGTTTPMLPGVGFVVID